MPIELKIIGETAKDVIGELLTFGDFYVRPSARAGVPVEATDTDHLKDRRDAGVSLPAAASAGPAPIALLNAQTNPSATENAATHDSAGLPWDERIHSSNRAFNADGTWRRRRGVSDDLVKQVEAELRKADHDRKNDEAVKTMAEAAELAAAEKVEEQAQVDTPEVEAQDAADEKAEADAVKEASGNKLTLDDVRAALGDYVKKFGMPAAQEDGPKVITLMFGEGKVKVSDIPDDQAALEKAVAGVREMIAKNPYSRAKVS